MELLDNHNEKISFPWAYGNISKLEVNSATKGNKRFDLEHQRDEKLLSPRK
jgi:hypothetical protein